MLELCCSQDGGLRLPPFALRATADKSAQSALLSDERSDIRGFSFRPMPAYLCAHADYSLGFAKGLAK